MVDFDSLRKARSTTNVTHPKDIFLRLPKPPGIDDLWQSQAEALDDWFDRRNEQDLVLKLNTGGGKTLVGLLIARSTLAEKGGPVLFLCATNQLAQQTISHARQFGITAVPYVSGQDLDGEFLSGRAIMVASYQALFNGWSYFGTLGGRREIVRPSAIVLDDAHTAFSVVRDQFSISIDKDKMPDVYQEVTQGFRFAFQEIGRQGTFDDITDGREEGVVEVPYWGWVRRCQEIRQMLAPLQRDNFSLEWPLIRDQFDKCHAFISRREIVITPLYPHIAMFPTFSECPRRIYMSATVADDSSIVRTFGANSSSVGKPISPTSLAGVGERMILVPDLMMIPRKDIKPILEEIASWAADRAGVVVLAPSAREAQNWEDTAEIVGGDAVASVVASLVNRTKNGPVVFAGRYDGIDLPSDSCRLLILSGLPTGSNAYDLYRAAVFQGSSAINTTIAQRVEQGMGRGTRGAGDHCVVILAGTSLAKWISNQANRELLTSPTRVQLNLGTDISGGIVSLEQLGKAVLQSFDRDQAWVEYQAEVLAEETSSPLVNEVSLLVADQERRYFRLLLDGYYDKAITRITSFVEKQPDIDSQVKGWLIQLAARAAWLWGDQEKCDVLQRQAYALNKMLLRPRVVPHYSPLVSPSDQSKQILENLKDYQPRRGFLVALEELADWLTPDATSNQFEESLKELGELLGYRTSRPDHEDHVGPDVLWILNESEALLVEAKSKKLDGNPINKGEHGQLLESLAWFSENYPNHVAQGAIVNSMPLVTPGVSPGGTFALTFSKLNALVGNARALFEAITSTNAGDDALLDQCEQLVQQLHLNPKGIRTYLDPFERQS